MATIAVTGAASGIGAACVDRLRAKGHRVIGVDLRDVEVIADLSTPEGRDHAIDAVGSAASEGLNGLVTCAGLMGAPSRPGSIVASVNYFGTVSLLEGLRPHLAAAEGAAVAISSNSTTIQPGVPIEIIEACESGDEELARSVADAIGSGATYAGTKLAVAYWVRSRATRPEWAGEGIRLNAIAPGMIDTPMIAAGRADPEVAPMLDMLPIPLGRPGQASEIAALVDFLLSDDAGFFCGSVVFADGGSDALLRTRDWPARWELEIKSAARVLAGKPAAEKSL